MEVHDISVCREMIQSEELGPNQSFIINFMLETDFSEEKDQGLDGIIVHFASSTVELNKDLPFFQKSRGPVGVVMDERKTIVLNYSSGIDLGKIQPSVDAVKFFKLGRELCIQYLTQRTRNALFVLERLDKKDDLKGMISSIRCKRVDAPTWTIYSQPNLYGYSDFLLFNIELLRAFSKFMPDFDVSEAEGVQEGEYTGNFYLEILNKVLANVRPKAFREYGIDLTCRIEDTDQILKYLTPSQLFYVMLDVYLPRSLCERFSESGFEGFVYWSIALGLKNQLTFEESLMKKPNDLLQDSQSFKMKQIIKAEHRRYALVDAMTVYEFGQSENFVTFLTEWYDALVDTDKPIMSKNLFSEYLLTLEEFCRDEAYIIRARTLKS